MRPLNRKLVRELWRLRGQMVSITLVVASGIMSVVTMRGSYETLIDAQASYYRQTRFADVWAPLERAPESVRRQLETIPGVAAVDTRVTFLASLDLPDLDAPALGRFVSVPDDHRPAINDIHLVAGRFIEPGGRDEAIISENFALARALGPGDSVRAVINGRLRDLRVVGVAISPEHTYAVPPGGLFPEDERYGILWMSRRLLGPVYEMDGAFNEALLSLAPDASLDAVLAQADEILDPYGGLGAYGREDQASHQIIEGELDQNRIMGTAIPAVFLGVAAFLLNLVLARLIATQRGEIGVLKAFGYTDGEVARHYLLFALAAVAVGALLGTLLGVALGRAYMNLYGAYFDFPSLSYRLSWPVVFIAWGVSLLAAVTGALGAARGAARLTPAEAMRPESPARYEPGWLDRAGPGQALSPASHMILRNLERRPVRALLSSVGVAFSVAILVIGMFMFDGVDFMMDLQFGEIQREDFTVSFNEPLAARVRYDLQHQPGVTRVETFRAAPARLRSGHIKREVALQAIEPDGRLRRIVTANGTVFPVPTQGLVLSSMLAGMLTVDTGDTLLVELLEGERRSGSLPVAGVIEDFLGLTAWMSPDGLRRLAGGPDVVSGAYLSVAEDRRSDVLASLKGMPAVAGVASPATMLESFRSQLGDSLFIAVGFLLLFAGVIAVGVIYNGARIALSERGRELASLRVIGFRRREVAVLLLGEQAIITAMAIPLGWVLGWTLSFAVVRGVQTEAYRIPLVISARTYLLSGLITVIAAAASGWLVRRRINNLDLIAVLKTRE